MNIYLSPLNPIKFVQKTEEKSGELERSYIQQFVVGDIISISILGNANTKATCIIEDMVLPFAPYASGNTKFYVLSINTSTLPKDKILSFELEIFDSGTEEYATFESTDFVEIVDECEELKKITYKGDSNVNQFNTYFGYGLEYTLRLPVGFKSTSIQNRLSAETFRNQNQELKLLYSAPYETQTLIIGNGLGVPTWMATLINYIFCLSDVTINGEKYIRSEESVPEVVGGIEGYPLHVYNMSVERIQGAYKVVFGDFNNDFNEDYRI